MVSSPDSETDAGDLSESTLNSSSSSICPLCRNNIDSPSQNGSQVYITTIANSHVTFEKFKTATNAALKGQFEGGSYDVVKALLVNWQANDIALKTPEAGSLIIDETKKLMGVFRDFYRFDTQYYSIPSETAETEVQKELGKIIDDLSKKKAGEKRVLLIVYYNGHGDVKDGMLIWAARKIWDLDSSTHPALSWYNLQGMLERAKFDVLLILDCCHAARAVTKGPAGTMEVLAGCSQENKAGGPGASSAIGSPFTSTLIKHLEESANTRPHGLLMTELQALLSLDEVLENQSPIHVALTGHHNPIKLRPLLSETKLKEIESSTSQTVKPELNALIAISFRGDVLPEMEEFVQWLKSQHPKEVVLERVSIEGSFDSSSTLMLLSMPISLWAHLDRSHCSLVGFVKSRNLLDDKSNRDRKSDDGKGRSDDAYEAEDGKGNNG